MTIVYISNLKVDSSPLLFSVYVTHLINDIALTWNPKVDSSQFVLFFDFYFFLLFLAFLCSSVNLFCLNRLCVCSLYSLFLFVFSSVRLPAWQFSKIYFASKNLPFYFLSLASSSSVGVGHSLIFAGQFLRDFFVLLLVLNSP